MHQFNQLLINDSPRAMRPCSFTALFMNKLNPLEPWPRRFELFMNEFSQRPYLPDGVCQKALMHTVTVWKTVAFSSFLPGLTGGHTVHIATRQLCPSCPPR